MKNTTAALQPGVYYHIYNRGNNRENLFLEERNYPSFLSLYEKHIHPIADTYAKAINKAYGRTGSLFEERFGRIPVTNTSYFETLIFYIHFNPQKHGFVTNFQDWQWSPTPFWWNSVQRI